MPFINSIISWFNIKRVYQIDLFKRYPLDVQREELIKLLKRAERTEWGQRYDFKSINSITEFQQRVPIQDYESIKADIMRVRCGEKNIFWPGEIKWFAKSSGTTSDKSKFIPVSYEGLEECHYRGIRDVLVIYNHNFPNNKIFKGKGLTLGGSHQISEFNNSSYYGDLSAILLDNSPFWTSLIKTPPQSVVLMDDWEKKMKIMTKITAKKNVTSISGVPSWVLILLKNILKYTKKTNILEVWPNLELFIHGGVNFTPYRQQYEDLIPNEKMNYMETYNASEGFFAIQNEPHKDDMLLMLDYGIFYEFIPSKDYGSPNPPVLNIEEIELFENYVLVITTNSGLWRYIIGDTIMFTSKYPYKIKITGRTKHFINAFGEELIIDNAEKALNIACKKTNSIIKEYTAAPVYFDHNKQGTHQWLIEFEKPPDDLEYFTTMLDNALASINSDYEAKRYKNITLRMPEVIPAQKGLFYQWLKKKGKLGGQNKVPRLANHRKYIDELLTMNKKMNNNR